MRRRDLTAFVLTVTELSGVFAPAQAAPAALRGVDFDFLSRVTYGPTTSTVADYRREGQRGFIRELLDGSGQLPPAVQQQIDALEISHRDGATLLTDAATEQKRIGNMPDGEEREAARKALNDHANSLLNETQKRELLRAMYSPAQLREQLVWFWLNQFSIHQGKANGRWLAGDYAEQAVRPHVLGRFADLVMATMTHPAMLQYLDNAQSYVGHVNENYARELLELHTLGVGSGYTQQDVQELARILTGLGVTVTGDRPKVKKEWEALYLRRGDFEFNPARHDFGAKQFLGKRIEGTGFDEVQQAIDIIVSRPECAQFVSRRLATYFVADEPPPALVERMSRTFQKTHGDLRAVMETLLTSLELVKSAGTKLRDPMQYVIASLRLAYEGRTIVNTRPIVGWLNSLGEAQFGRVTPDGYPLVSSAWTSSGQMSRRFEIARAIASNAAGLFQPENGAVPGAPPPPGFPQLASRFYYDAIEPRLGADTRAALARASSQAEWNTYLLASPELNYR
ncbi:MAG TPA: DUF1800 domain-containing protein [Steroidobacteraceae bacterium]|nr:DUF1800 domain-containing protein [Steroidobacteraceae bacterium]